MKLQSTQHVFAKPENYLHGLYGLRALACLIVLLAHLNKEVVILAPFAKTKILSNGIDGVTIFFVLSGFLITYRLYDSIVLGSLTVKQFIYKRARRILPLYYLYLAICIILCLILRPDWIELPAILMYLFMIPNVAWINSINIPFAGHYWSLGVEEQFYLLFPIVVRYVHRYFLSILVMLLICFFALKLFLVTQEDSVFINSFIYALGFHHILIGCIGAYLYRKYFNIINSWIDHKVTQGLGWLLLVFMLLFFYPINLRSEIIAFLTLIIIYGQIGVRNRIINLDGKLLYYIGSISYGIYVFHDLVIEVVKQLMIIIFDNTQQMSVVGIFYFSNIMLLFLTAHLSFVYFESFFLKRKNNI